ncbi:PREDICTED: putative tRNA pseudouridine synthase Pus10 [Polistes canadensis]|uniref:putative tRNA pseudouridine synthase Pus10 n=1 Tax=Polistes canadensis TaxID=91411 RepID=UPI000718AD46|nr:PREDICTED: putative tRNA pseudouridine synthase Pus10 [Polistes canadensis]
MSSTLTEEGKKIFHVLRLEKCCLRCCLRFTGCNNPKYYQDLDELKNLIQSSEEKQVCVKETDLPCIACLGILQSKIEESVIKRIKQKVQNENYDCSTFTCALTVPISLFLRERSLHIYVAKKLNLTKDEYSTLKYKTLNVKDIWKWIALPKLEDIIGKRPDLTTPSPFLLEIFFLYVNDENECYTLLDQLGNNYDECSKQERMNRKRKYGNNKCSRKNIESVMISITDEMFQKYYLFPPTQPDSFINIEKVLCSHSSIFIGGRYNKLSRQLCQTPWFIDGEKKMETSVQDIICEPIVKAVKAESIKFQSSGREDVDVRNIHSGRPFAIELINPRITKISTELLSSLVTIINDSSTQVKITTNLKLLTRDDLKKLKEGENVKTKFYRALCVCRNAPQDKSNIELLNELKNVEIIQKTPIRVLHRRPLTPRVRYIYDMRARWAKPQELLNLPNAPTDTDNMFFVLDVRAQAGTYVKEFVHGDFGRTKPSLCDLLNTEVDIVALDVTGINLDWP